MKNILIAILIVLALTGSIVYAIIFNSDQPFWRKTADVQQRPDAVVKFDPAGNPNKLIESLAEQTAWQNYHEQFVPKTGEMAVDFELKDIEGKETFRLADYRGNQPVALIFGSFT